MEVLDCIKTRRSVRKFKDEAVPHELIAEVVAAAAWAPSWKNTQTARYIVLEDRELKDRIAEECVLGFKFNTMTAKGAPALVLLTCVNKRCGYERDGSFSTSKGDRWEMFDAGVAAQTFCLAAHEKGLGTVILGVFDEAKIAEMAEIPEGQSVSALIALGYPDEEPAAPKRKTVEDLLSFK